MMSFINKKNMKTNTFLCCLLLVAALSTASSVQAQTPAETNTEKIQTVGTGAVSSRISKKLNGKNYVLLMSNQQVSGLWVDGKEIPPADWDSYGTEVATLKLQLKKDQQRASVEQLRSLGDKKESLADREKSLKERNVSLTLRAQAERSRVLAEKQKDAAERSRERSDKDKISAEIDRNTAEGDRILLEGLMGDLVTDQIVPGKNALKSLAFEAAGMRVNGTLQSREVWGKYFKKYPGLSRPGAKYSFDGIVGKP
jgi:hypothetical protein